MEDPLEHRKTAARMANRARESGSDWFEEFYQWTGGDEVKVPWADLEPHPLLVEWLNGRRLGSAAIVGCGLGDDAEAASRHADSVWAFDVSETAVEWAQRRFPDSSVVYETSDLFRLPAERRFAFSTVIEIYTLQALPPERRQAALESLASLVSTAGELVIITRWREPEAELGPVPWPLLMSELDELDRLGLTRTEQTSEPAGQAIRLVWRKP